MDFKQNITEHFKLSEFVTTTFDRDKLRLEFLAENDVLFRKGELDMIYRFGRLAGALEYIRKFCGAPIIILSCYRSSRVNKLVHGSKTSQHRTGSAVDFFCPSMRADDFFSLVKRALEFHNIEYDQLIFYSRRGFVHLGLFRYNIGTSIRRPSRRMIIYK
uniref:Peptidase n=1 Tax=Dulem virus 264 TaxID=3145741 RepID=A0AAU8B3E2_9VIRU